MIQVEVTTKCNLSCFYCAGRHMPQKNMDLEVYKGVISQIRPGSLIHLQGEGEPLLHPNFLEMIALARTQGLRVTTTTNGTIPFDINLVDKLHVSVDTLDAEQNAKTGRNHFDKTMANLLQWIGIDRTKLLIRITEYGQDTSSILEFCKENKLQYLAQALNQKDDYSVAYAVEPMWIDRERKPFCSILASGDRYFTADGTKLPCCFIKFPTETYEEIKLAFDGGLIPSSCKGCRMLKFK